MKQNECLVIIPVYNEEKNIEAVLDNIIKIKKGFDLILINDGSIDNTEEILKKKGVCYLSHPYNLGYGAALQTGYKYAVCLGYKYVIQMDGDGQHNPMDIFKILEALTKTNNDIIIGSRYLNKNSTNIENNIFKKIAVAFFGFLIKLLTKAKITDPTSGFQGLSYDAFEFYSKMNNFVSDFPDADILIKMLRLKYKVFEISVNINKREFGKSMHSGFKPLYYMVKVFLSIIIIIAREKLLKEGKNCANRNKITG